MAHESRAGLVGDHSAERVLTAEAERRGIPMHSEFAPPEGPFIAFSTMPHEAELDYLRWMLDAVEAGADEQRRFAEAWARGDLQASNEETAAMRADYPAFHAHMIAGRNRAWLPRIDEIFAHRARAFIIMGGGHLVGDDGVIALLKNAGYAVQPSPAGKPT
jgi:uncharacterized protein YbaP (TraB family)